MRHRATDEAMSMLNNRTEMKAGYQGNASSLGLEIWSGTRNQGDQQCKWVANRPPNYGTKAYVSQATLTLLIGY